MVITLRRTHKENYNIQTFWFKPEKSLTYNPGQFIEMYLPHNNPDERGIKRWFTLSSSPSEKLISITTKFFGNEASTFKKQLFSLKPGDEVKIVEPMGDFVLPKDKNKPLVFVAGGIGITPFHSMAKWLVDTGEKRKITVLLAANTAKDFIFVDLFHRTGAKVIQMVSVPSTNWLGLVGQLSSRKILALTGNPGDKLLYVSGPEPMVETLETQLVSNGVSKDQLVLDFFPGYRSDLK
jgi:ferredoxin-NADP reductase